MPDVLAALIAFVAEHRGCGDLDGGLEGGVVWLKCSCTARLAHPADAPPADRGGCSWRGWKLAAPGRFRGAKQ